MTPTARGMAVPLRHATVLALVLSASRPARAVDPFEIQVYDGTIAAPGEAGVELHLNHVALGQTTAAPPGLPTHHVTHATLEPSYGLTRWCELGAYLQTALRPDGRYDFAGVKLRSKFVVPDRGAWRAGVNVELAGLPVAYDEDRFGLEIRPILAWESPRVLVAVNPILAVPLSARSVGHGPFFEPAFAFKVKPTEAFAVGLETYSSFGALGSPAAFRDQVHYLFETFDLLSVRRFELEVGVGEGLTPASDRLIVKAILGYTFGGDGPR